MAGQAITRALTASFGAMNSDNGPDKDNAPDKTGQNTAGAFPNRAGGFPAGRRCLSEHPSEQHSAAPDRVAADEVSKRARRTKASLLIW
jgi:hypothetical protein